MRPSWYQLQSNPRFCLTNIQINCYSSNCFFFVFCSPDWIRTSDHSINSRGLYRWATEEYMACKSWKGRIRTAVPVREQIYSLPVLTTHPPSIVGKQEWLYQVSRPYTEVLDFTHHKRFVLSVYPCESVLPACHSTLPLFPFCGTSWSRTSGTWIFSPLLYLLSYRTISIKSKNFLLCGWDLNPRPWLYKSPALTSELPHNNYLQV